MLKKLAIALRALLPSVAAEKRAELEAQIQAIEAEAEADTPPAQPSTPPATPPVPPPLPDAGQVELLRQNQLLAAQLKQLQDALAAEAAQRRTAQEAIEAQRKRDFAASVEAKLGEYLKTGKITETDKTRVKARLEKDFQEWSAHYDALPVNPATNPNKPTDSKNDPPARPTAGRLGVKTVFSDYVNAQIGSA